MKTKMRKGKVLSAVLSLVMGAAMLPQAALTSFAAAGDVFSVGNGTNQHKGVSEGFSYEIWIDTTGGSGTMTLGEGATFKAEWSASVSSGNFLARRGLDFGSEKKATEYEYIGLDYEADYRQTGSASGNSRLCVYGWFQNKNAGNVPLVEYYIIEDWVDWVPDATGTMVTIDGAQYKIFQMDHTGPTINGTTETFKQYFSVRQDKRKSGHITVSDHFQAWADQGWGIGNLYEVALNAEGWQSSGVADITMLNVYTDPDQAGEQPTTEAPTQPDPDENGYYFYAPFESGKDGWTVRGEDTVEQSSKAAYLGSKSLYVSGRTDSWNGAGYTLSTSTFVPGTSYSFSAMVMQNEAASEDFKLSLQYDLNGEANYATVAEATGAKGEWVQLSNTSFTIPSGASNLLLYVETAEGLTSFYMDEAMGAPKGTIYEASGTSSAKGDVDSDGNTNVTDIIRMQKWLLGQNVTISNAQADLDGDGSITAFDLAILKKGVLKGIWNVTEEPEEPTTEQPTTEAPERVEGQWYNTADISWIDTSKPMVALSFDDGPVGTLSSDTSIRIQDALAENGHHATFFYWGNFINSGNQGEITRAHQLGFEVANHTMSHPYLTNLSASEVQNEINSCKSILTGLTGQDNFLIRPPYLAVNSTVQANAGAPLITCAVDSADWNGATAQDMINKITAGMNDGSLDNTIVLMHETYTSTAEAIEYLAPYMKQQGWQIVTVSELFKANGKEMQDGVVYTRVN